MTTNISILLATASNDVPELLHGGNVAEHHEILKAIDLISDVIGCHVDVWADVRRVNRVGPTNANASVHICYGSEA